jgi:POT family proton-dependent oligopeptide transporter
VALGLSQQTVTILLSFAVVPALYFLLQYKSLVDILLIVALVVVAAQLLMAAFGGDAPQRDKIIVLMILMVFNVVFWACFEQAGSSLTLFADRNVDRDVFGIFVMPASQTQFFNPAFIIVFGSVFSWMWVFLDQRNLNPNIPLKFGLGLVLLGLGYLTLWLGAGMAEAALVPLMILALMYLLHTLGELCLSPIGLSMVTKLAPKQMTGQVMGAWFLSFAFAQSAAATLAQLTGVEGAHAPIDGLVDAADALLDPRGSLDLLVEHGREMMHPEFLANAAAAAEKSLASYVDIYTTMGLVSVVIGIVLALASPFLNKMMHGVK